ncbi:MAG: multicopper oxidase domain-containing protein [Candidatus Eremiobacteraeota bacterium]|nr:multicopper oxidase domain-containing protein [Candidatus Eremiobacteraeota bacterium]
MAVAFVALGVAVAGSSESRRAAAQAPAGLPAFHAAPSFGSPRGEPKPFLLAQAGGGCNPGPERITGAHNVALNLTLQRSDSTINNPTSGRNDKLTLRNYDGCLTSPVITARPGDTVRITLHNALSKNDPSCVPPSMPPYYLPPGVGCFNTTNLHTHGLHVSPTIGPYGAGDNVQLTIDPQATQQYSIDIPTDHPAGTFWYHAHQHGSTAVDVASALAGPLIVQGTRRYPQPNADVDTILRGVPDTAFVFQQIAYGCFADDAYTKLITDSGLATIAPPKPAALLAAAPPTATPTPPPASAHWLCPAPSGTYPVVTSGVVENFQLQLFSPTIWDTNGRFTSINGVVQPSITLPAGQIQRWRFIHAGIHDTINLQIVKMRPLAANAFGLGTLTNASIASALAGKTRRQQAPVVRRLCDVAVANEQTLLSQFEIAVDGLTRTQIREINPPGEKPIETPAPTSSMPPSPPLFRSNYLQPGYRSDVLVVFPQTNSYYCVLDQTAPASERVNTGGGGGQGPSDPQLLAVVHTQGGTNVGVGLAKYVYRSLQKANPNVPGLSTGDLTPFAPFSKGLPLPANHGQRRVNFFIGVVPPKPQLVFTVNGRSYAPNVVPKEFILKLGATDEWKVAVQPLTGGEPHIFHIHINPFEVIDVRKAGKNGGPSVSIFNSDGTCKPEIVGGDAQSLAEQYCGMYHVFRDTLFIENGYEITLRTRYDRYVGEFVLHCHILDHEDAGMMTNVEIVRDPHHPPPPERVKMPAMHMTHR